MFLTTAFPRRFVHSHTSVLQAHSPLLATPTPLLLLLFMMPSSSRKRKATEPAAPAAANEPQQTRPTLTCNAVVFPQPPSTLGWHVNVTMPSSHSSSSSSSCSSSSPSSSSSSTSCTSNYPTSSPFAFPRPASMCGWSGLPAALFDHVCSYVRKPILDTFLVMSGVCREWSQLLDGDAGGRFNCWRHVPPTVLLVGTDRVEMHCSSARVVRQPENVALMVHTLRRVPSIEVRMYKAVDLPAHIRFLDLLFLPNLAALSSSLSSEPSAARPSRSRLLLTHLAIDSAVGFTSAPEKELFSASLSNCFIRSPPLRSVLLGRTDVGPSAAALRHLCGGGRLLHLELNAAALSSMVWGDRLESAAEAEATQPWRGATTLQSLALHTEWQFRASDSADTLRRALPVLQHLHLSYHNNISDADLSAVHHLGSRLTFLRLYIAVPLPSYVADQLSALQSLFLHINSATRDPVRIFNWLRQLPQLSELTLIAVGSNNARGRVPGGMLLLPPSLTYLQLSCKLEVVLSVQAANTDTVDPPAFLPSSLRCLSLVLPNKALTPSLLDSIPRLFPDLTHCFVDSTDKQKASWTERAKWIQGQNALREQLGVAVWCNGEDGVEQQRLDKRWQREMGVQVWNY